MLTVDDALQLVLQHCGSQQTQQVALSEAYGLVLAKSVCSDLDSPPFTKALMDGFAVRNDDMDTSPVTLRVLGEISAGQSADKEVTSGECYQIMTGAPIPPGADAVVMVERSNRTGDRVVLTDPQFSPNQNTMPKGRELKEGEEVLSHRALLGPATIGLLATVGVAAPLVYQRPRVAVLSTGDEIVPPGEKPGVGQIRNSNAATLHALLTAQGAHVVDLGIATDDVEILREKVRQGLQYDCLLLTGGVSAGKKDFVPQVLAENSVEQVFHKVNLKPGKPVWFGKHEKGIVFGLPGNPVSVLVCFELFVTTALRGRQHHPHPEPPFGKISLGSAFPYPTNRETFYPAELVSTTDGVVAEPLDWFGSPDLKALTKAAGLLRCPVTDQAEYPAGSTLTWLPLSLPAATSLA